MGHTLHDCARHTDWRPDREPAIRIAPGERVELFARDASNGYFSKDSRASDVPGLDQDTVNPVTGPIAVDGAQAGAALEVRLKTVETEDWGWTANIPGFGLLADDFPEPAFLAWRIDRGRGVAEAGDGSGWAPLHPFMGTLGVSPGAPGPHAIIPPWRTGGNLDCRDLCPGARVLLPVEADGALLSAGDGHAAQGDGEVCGTAIETVTRLELEVELVKDRPMRAPIVRAPAAAMPRCEPRLTTTGVGPDLHEACRDAVRQMIDELTGRRGLSAEQAYLHASVSGDLRIAQLVDAPNWTAAVSFPLARLS